MHAKRSRMSDLKLKVSVQLWVSRSSGGFKKPLLVMHLKQQNDIFT